MARNRPWVGPSLDDRLRAWEERMRVEKEKEAILNAYRQARGLSRPAGPDTTAFGVRAAAPPDPNGLDDWTWLPWPPKGQLWVSGVDHDDDNG